MSCKSHEKKSQKKKKAVAAMLLGVSCNFSGIERFWQSQMRGDSKVYADQGNLLLLFMAVSILFQILQSDVPALQ